MKLYIDNNIFLDFMLRREPFFLYAAKLIDISLRGEHELYMSALSLANINYIASKELKQDSVDQYYLNLGKLQLCCH